MRFAFGCCNTGLLYLLVSLLQNTNNLFTVSSHQAPRTTNTAERSILYKVILNTGALSQKPDLCPLLDHQFVPPLSQIPVYTVRDRVAADATLAPGWEVSISDFRVQLNAV